MKPVRSRWYPINALTTSIRLLSASKIATLFASSLAVSVVLSPALILPALLLYPGGTLQATPAPGAAGSGVPSGTVADSQMTRTLCSMLKRLNARRGLPAAELQMDLIMSVGKSVEFDRARVAQVRKDIDRLTTAGCPVDRELTLSILKAKSLEQAMK